jgi:hypothetical protein
MRVPHKPYDAPEIETVFVHEHEVEEDESHPQFGSNDPRRNQEMRDFYGIEEIKRNQE